MTILHSLLITGVAFAMLMFVATKLARFSTGFAVLCAVRCAIGFWGGIIAVITILLLSAMHVATCAGH